MSVLLEHLIKKMLIHKPCVLAYHSIGEPHLSLPKKVFSDQMAFLKKHHFNVVTMNTFAAMVKEKQSLKNTVVLTFDDCFHSAIEHALPILNEHDFKATFYVTLDYINTTMWGNKTTQTWHAQLEQGLEPFTMVTEDDLELLLAANMEIGSHTLSHQNLDQLNAKQAQFEISESRIKLRSQISQDIHSFCYPRGRFTDDICQMVADAGYHTAVSTQQDVYREHHFPYTIPRLYVYKTGWKFALEMAGIYARFYKYKLK